MGSPGETWVKRAVSAEKVKMTDDAEKRKGSEGGDERRRPEEVTPTRATPRMNLERELGRRGRGGRGKSSRSYLEVMRDQERRYSGST